MFNVAKTSKRAVNQITEYIHSYQSFQQEQFGKTFYVDKPIDFFRPNDTKISRDLTKVHPEEIINAIKLAIETKINPTEEDVIKEVYSLFNITKRSKSMTQWIQTCLELAIKENAVMVTVEGYLTN